MISLGMPSRCASCSSTCGAKSGSPRAPPRLSRAWALVPTRQNRWYFRRRLLSIRPASSRPSHSKSSDSPGPTKDMAALRISAPPISRSGSRSRCVSVRFLCFRVVRAEISLPLALFLALLPFSLCVCACNSWLQSLTDLGLPVNGSDGIFMNLNRTSGWPGNFAPMPEAW